MGTVRVAIVGVGNCASSLVQGVEYYKDADPTGTVPGLMHVMFGDYHVSDVEFVAAFDVDDKYYRLTIEESGAEPVDIVQTLKDARVDVLVSYLPVGSEDADKYYAQCAIDA